jgi:hypothetical protein
MAAIKPAEYFVSVSAPVETFNHDRIEAAVIVHYGLILLFCFPLTHWAFLLDVSDSDRFVVICLPVLHFLLDDFYLAGMHCLGDVSDRHSFQ